MTADLNERTGFLGQLPDEPSREVLAEDPLARLVWLRDLSEAVEAAMHVEARRLRECRPKVPYADFGKALGVSRQAAWERFGKRINDAKKS